MKDLINIIDNNLGADRMLHAAYDLNSIPYIIYKEHDGTRCVVIKNNKGEPQLRIQHSKIDSEYYEDVMLERLSNINKKNNILM